MAVSLSENGVLLPKKNLMSFYPLSRVTTSYANNAQLWLGQAGDDPDLFVELITFGETRTYIRRIREHYAFYQALYGER